MYHHHKFRPWIFTTQSTHYHGFSTGNGQNSHKHHLCALRYITSLQHPGACGNALENNTRTSLYTSSLVTHSSTSMSSTMRFAAAVSPVLQRLDLSDGYTERATPSLAEPAVPEQMIIWVMPRINPPAIRSPSLFRLVQSVSQSVSFVSRGNPGLLVPSNAPPDSHGSALEHMAPGPLYLSPEVKPMASASFPFSWLGVAVISV